MRLDDDGQKLVRTALERLTAKHHQSVNRMTKEFEAERKRLETMLRWKFVPQRVDT